MAATTVTLSSTAVKLGTVAESVPEGEFGSTLIVQNMGSTECYVDTVAGSGTAGIALAPASGTTPGGTLTETRAGVALYAWVASGSGSVTVDTI